MAAILNLAAMLEFWVRCYLEFDKICQILHLDVYLVNFKHISGYKLLR